jgi:hypothetical protein
VRHEGCTDHNERDGWFLFDDDDWHGLVRARVITWWVGTSNRPFEASHPELVYTFKLFV